jgi:hypothetical protein
MSWEYIDTIYFGDFPVFRRKTALVRVYMGIDKREFLSGEVRGER